MRNEIDRAAADWAARIDRAPLDAEDNARFDAWIAADPRHLGAYAHARAVLLHFDRAQALGPDFDAARFAPDADEPRRFSSVSRRGALRFGAGALAASVAGAVAVGVHEQLVAPLLSTTRGEIRRVPLPDGSVVTLNTVTRLAVDFSDAERRVRLLEGEALFDVAKDARRPFTVEANGTRVTAIGTSFSVRRLASVADVEVLVREGVVEMTRPVQARFEPVRLTANMIARAEPDQPVEASTVEIAAVFRKLAWRDGMIAFHGETLAQAADEFARYSDTRITIDDPAIAARTVTGLFAANDPAGFARTVEASFGLKAELRGNKVRLTRPRS